MGKSLLPQDLTLKDPNFNRSTGQPLRPDLGRNRTKSVCYKLWYGHSRPKNWNQDNWTTGNNRIRGPRWSTLEIQDQENFAEFSQIFHHWAQTDEDLTSLHQTSYKRRSQISQHFLSSTTPRMHLKQITHFRKAVSGSRDEDTPKDTFFHTSLPALIYRTWPGSMPMCNVHETFPFREGALQALAQWKSFRNAAYVLKQLPPNDLNIGSSKPQRYEPQCHHRCIAAATSTSMITLRARALFITLPPEPVDIGNVTEPVAGCGSRQDDYLDERIPMVSEDRKMIPHLSPLPSKEQKTFHAEEIYAISTELALKSVLTHDDKKDVLFGLSMYHHIQSPAHGRALRNSGTSVTPFGTLLSALKARRNIFIFTLRGINLRYQGFRERLSFAHKSIELANARPDASVLDEDWSLKHGERLLVTASRITDFYSPHGLLGFVLFSSPPLDSDIGKDQRFHQEVVRFDSGFLDKLRGAKVSIVLLPVGNAGKDNVLKVAQHLTILKHRQWNSPASVAYPTCAATCSEILTANVACATASAVNDCFCSHLSWPAACKFVCTGQPERTSVAQWYWAVCLSQMDYSLDCRRFQMDDGIKLLLFGTMLIVFNTHGHALSLIRTFSFNYHHRRTYHSHNHAWACYMIKETNGTEKKEKEGLILVLKHFFQLLLDILENNRTPGALGGGFGGSRALDERLGGIETNLHALRNLVQRLIDARVPGNVDIDSFEDNLPMAFTYPIYMDIFSNPVSVITSQTHRNQGCLHTFCGNTQCYSINIKLLHNVAECAREFMARDSRCPIDRNRVTGVNDHRLLAGIVTMFIRRYPNRSRVNGAVPSTRRMTEKGEVLWLMVSLAKYVIDWLSTLCSIAPYYQHCLRFLILPNVLAYEL
ncbi:uncharacterized protein BDR25DRAFT_355913 [Lindgomyces ingoldianus]|uniref:Uncharacterized protein n=1 Tax=Lindgomyces ingoldianus TaxID=673940 RepID=A0ACB6QVJ1_9PLEO|nr:uncharacterized protein BDR25DRAFT_355913 [Lindgomyces ingoldianus]KAF2470211.1 hypothetical protein BDR25DRAFT_355913 [Lindgomyces ingoldianus]